ncbi:MAG: prepilin-type N-terminal cleavage/methylation domain-containing protein [SAR202 cluster bacterium]|nr:prepilin-type N-terminal cleavage/methylation domain-containing protein [SAR202 cluster bacterium]
MPQPRHLGASALRHLRNRKGFTLLELALTTAIGGMLLVGVVAQLQTVPAMTATQLALDGESRAAEQWIRLDAGQAQSFEPLPVPEYGRFRWLDVSVASSVQREVTYFWDDGVLYRQVTGPPAEAGDPQGIAHHVLQYDDVTFTLTETASPGSPTSTVQQMAATFTTTGGDALEDAIARTASWQVHMRTQKALTLPTPTPTPTPSPLWLTLAPVPIAADNGGSITTDGTNVYALSGDGTPAFHVYAIASNTWGPLPDAPAKVGSGGASVFAGGHVYALRGANRTDFWR